jgi:protocatechuate 3,4-dioxygenase beta subunit
MAGAAAFAYATRSSIARADASTPSCVLNDEQTVGPYYLDLERIRKDITEGKPGLPLKLRVSIVDGMRCMPIQNAALDIWHCDAFGVYSGFAANRPDVPPGMPPPDFDGP